MKKRSIRTYLMAALTATTFLAVASAPAGAWETDVFDPPTEEDAGSPSSSTPWDTLVCNNNPTEFTTQMNTAYTGTTFRISLTKTVEVDGVVRARFTNNSSSPTECNLSFIFDITVYRGLRKDAVGDVVIYDLASWQERFVNGSLQRRICFSDGFNLPNTGVLLSNAGGPSESLIARKLESHYQQNPCIEYRA